MNGNGFLLSKYMFAEAQECQSQEEAMGRGCGGRMMSLVRQGPAGHPEGLLSVSRDGVSELVRAE